LSSVYLNLYVIGIQPPNGDSGRRADFGQSSREAGSTVQVLPVQGENLDKIINDAQSVECKFYYMYDNEILLISFLLLFLNSGPQNVPEVRQDAALDQ
jgi:hypothetical protein